MVKSQFNKKNHGAPVVFYDGECGLCDGVVRLFINHNSNRNIKYCQLQSEAAKQILQEKAADMRTIIYMGKGVIYTESQAFFEAIKHLDYPLRILTVFRLVPKVFSDAAYRFIARNRYQIFGSKKIGK